MNNICIICNSKKIKTFIRRKDLPNKREVSRCNDCGLVFFQNEKADLDDTYWNEGKQRRMYEENRVRKAFEGEFRERLRAISSFIQKGKLLDIGCGMAEFLNIAKASGWQTYGIEISKKTADFAKHRYGFDIFCGTVENCNFKDESFDVITLWDVIEHIQYPQETMKAINRKLKKGGVLVIKTPDENGLFKRVASLLYIISGKKLKFLLKYVYYLPHYFSYSPKTLKRLLENYGFKVVRLEKGRTNMDFARTKIRHHYAKYRSKMFVLLALPLVYFLMDIFNFHNKIVVYARKYD